MGLSLLITVVLATQVADLAADVEGLQAPDSFTGSVLLAWFGNVALLIGSLMVVAGVVLRGIFPPAEQRVEPAIDHYS